MIPTIKLLDSPKTLDLFADRYDIYILGGRMVKLNSFQIGIVNKSTNENIPVTEYPIKLRSFSGVRCFYFDITKIGSYEVTFYNTNKLSVRKSMLSIRQFFQSDINHADIRIEIKKKH